jgi:hypothetical protein
MELKGLRKDGRPKHGTWVGARNMVISPDNDAIENELGFSEKQSFDGPIIGTITTPREVVYFVIEPTGQRIILERNGIFTTIINDGLLQLSIDRPIEGTYHYNNKNELVIVWWETLSESANPPRILNVDCLPFTLDGTLGFNTLEDLYKLQLFPRTTYIEKSINVLNSSGQLKTGAYYLACAYVFNDGSATPCFDIGNPVYINEDPNTNFFTEYDGAEPDTLTTKAIEFELDNIDNTYYAFRPYIVKKIGGVISAVQLPDIPINGMQLRFIYGSDSNAIEVPIESIIIPNTILKKVWAGTSMNNRLHFANAVEEEAPDLQQYINNIKVEWQRNETIDLGKNTGSYKDPSVLYLNKSFKSGEVYAFYFIAKMLSGKEYAFHIPGRAPVVANISGTRLENEFVQDLLDDGIVDTKLDEAILVAADMKIYQGFDMGSDAAGRMAYWENEDELYADEDCWDVKDSGGTVIDTLRNLNVRHHKFPTIRRLQLDHGEDFYNITGGLGTIGLISEIEYDKASGDTFTANYAGISGYDADYTLVSNTGGIGGWSINNSRYTATQRQTLRIEASWNLTNLTDDLLIRIQVHRTSGLSEVIFLTTYQNPSLTDILEFEVTLESGDYVKFWNSYFVPSGSPTDPDGTINFKLYNPNPELVDGTTKALGIKISDVHIPSQIKQQMACFYIGYAKRDSTNITRVGQGTILNFLYSSAGSLEDEYRSHPFDILKFKSNVGIDYLDMNLQVGDGTYNAPDMFSNDLALPEFRSVQESFIVPENVATPVNNSLAEENLYIKLNTQITIPQYFFYHCDFCVYRRNMYLTFKQQEVIKIDKPISVNTVAANNIFGGDITIQYYGFYTDYIGTSPGGVVNPGFTMDRFLTIVESIALIGYRHADEAQNEFYYPRYLNSIGSISQQIDEVETVEDLLLTDSNRSQALLYNTDYNSLNDLKLPIIVDCEEQCVGSAIEAEYPYRVYRSIQTTNEDYQLDWRTFLVNDYYEMQKSKGVVWNLAAFNNTLLIHQEYSLFVAMENQKLEVNLVEVFVGSGDIFTAKPRTVTFDPSGTAGTQHKFGCFVCKYGYIFPDANQGKVFLFDGTLTEISNINNREWFRRNMTYEILGDYSLDNPYTDNGFFGGYDERFNRALVGRVKRDDTRIDPSLTWVMSFDFNNKFWVSRHDWNISFITFNRTNMYAVYNNDEVSIEDNKVFEINSEGFGTRGFYTDGIIRDAFIEYVLEIGQDVRWDVIKFVVEAFDSFGQKVQNGVFSKIMVYNDSQCTGEIELVIKDGLQFADKYNTFKANTEWAFNKLRDIVVNPDNFFVVRDTDLIFTANLDDTVAYFKKPKIVGDYLVIRLIYSNLGQLKLKLFNVDAVVKPINRK